MNEQQTTMPTDSQNAISTSTSMRYVDGHPAHIAIIGAGAFGTALASVALRGGAAVTIISHEPQKSGEYLSDPILAQCNFDIQHSTTLDLGDFDFVVLAISSQAIRDVAQWIFSHQKKLSSTKQLNIVCAAKGIERETLMLPSQILAKILPPSTLIGTLSGPSFAKELRQNLPAAVVFASSNAGFIRLVKTVLHRAYFRIYDCDDEIGIEIAGALKNVIAIVAGGCDGLGLGNNARAAVVTRGFGEIVQIGVRMGANAITFLGLGGLGDLFLTTSGDLSRNRQLGLQLARGEKKETIIAKTGEVIEGIATAESAFQLAKKLGVETPVIQAAYGVLYENLAVNEAVMSLVTRSHKSEFDWTKDSKAHL